MFTIFFTSCEQNLNVFKLTGKILNVRAHNIHKDMWLLKIILGISLVQQLRLHAPKGKGPGFDTWSGELGSHMPQPRPSTVKK